MGRYDLTDFEWRVIKPLLPDKPRGVPRVDDRRILSGTIFISHNGLRWRDAPNEYGLAKTFYTRWKRWGDLGVIARKMEGLASEAAVPKTSMIDAT
mgnify:CR=1 FL=1